MLNHLTVTAPKGRHQWTDCTRVDYQLCPKYEDLVATSGRTVPCHHWPIICFYFSAGFALILRTYYKCELRPILFHDVPRCGLSVSRAKLVAQLFAIRTWSSIKGTAAPAPLGSYRWSLGMSCPCSFSLHNCCIVPYWFVLSLRLYVQCVLYPGMGCVWEVFGTSCPSSLPLLLPSPSRFRFSLLKSTS